MTLWEKIRFARWMLFHANRKYVSLLFRRWLAGFSTLAAFVCGWAGLLMNRIYNGDEIIVVAGLVIVTALASFVWAVPNCYHRHKIGRRDCSIELVVGDMIEASDDMIIPANTFFDTNETISKWSIQGQLAERRFGNNFELLDGMLAKAIKTSGLEGVEVPEKMRGKNIRYPLNSIVWVSKKRDEDAQRFYWLAMCDFNNDGSIIKERTDIEASVAAVWNYLKERPHVRTLCMPVLGTGLTPDGMAPFDVIGMIVDTFLTEVTGDGLVKSLRIYLYPKDSETFTTFKLADGYIRYRIRNLGTERLKPDYRSRWGVTSGVTPPKKSQFFSSLKYCHPAPRT